MIVHAKMRKAKSSDGCQGQDSFFQQGCWFLKYLRARAVVENIGKARYCAFKRTMLFLCRSPLRGRQFARHWTELWLQLPRFHSPT